MQVGDGSSAVAAALGRCLSNPARVQSVPAACQLPVSPSGTCGSGSLKAFVTPGTGGGGLQGALPCAGCGKAEAGWFLQDLSEEQPPGRAP